jgi:hypothetical protein
MYIFKNITKKIRQEKHLNNQITDEDIAISGFDVHNRKDRNSHGGGIIMYHKSNINVLRRVDL